MIEAELHDWLIAQPKFQSDYNALRRASVAAQFSVLDEHVSEHDWNYLLKCSSFLAYSRKAFMQDIALRIAQHCLQKIANTTPSQKDSAQFILNILANRRAIDLAHDRGLTPLDSSKWQDTFVGNLNWVKQEVEHSVWLKNGERLNVNVFQKAFWEALETHQSLSISAPTSAGKSHLIKQWIHEKLTDGSKKVIVYVVPTRALISEVESDFQNALTEEIKSSRVNLTSFPFIKFADDKKPCIYVLTQERLQLLLERMNHTIDVLIVDEAYKLADDDRGILLQHVIEKTSLSNPKLKIVYISPLATNPELLVENTDGYSERFEDVTVNQNLIWATQKRGANWKLELCHPDGKTEIGELTLKSNPSPASQRLPMLAFSLGQTGGSIIYVNGAADAEKAAHQLCDLIGFDNVRNDQRLLELIELCEKVIHKEYRLIEALRYGVAFHYGNIPLLIREEVEALFRDGVIQFLVCTSTLVEGVNLPCRNIFIRSPKRGDKPMNAGDFWNLAGRAGRWGKDFQGNIICLDPTVWNAPDKKSFFPITKATETALTRQTELVEFITKGTPRATASSQRILESMASYLAISYKSYGSIASIPWIGKIDPLQVAELEEVVSKNLLNVSIPTEVTRAHPGISPLAMQAMLLFFEGFKGPLEQLLVPLATDTDSVGGYVKIFKSMFGRLTNEFGDQDGYLFREAIVTVHWMQGRPIKRIIEERRKVAPPKETIHVTIRNILQDIESIARFKAPKYMSCYNDILRMFLVNSGRHDLAEKIEDLTLFLEMGVNTTTHLSLMNLGLSRTSAVELKEYITTDNFTESDCLKWLTNPQNNWRSRDLPQIVKREIEKLLQVHAA